MEETIFIYHIYQLYSSVVPVNINVIEPIYLKDNTEEIHILKTEYIYDCSYCKNTVIKY